jgi:hypothetical protein
MRTWPWITSVLTGILLLLPLTWDIVGSAIRQSPTDWLRELWLIISLTGLAAILVLALAEWQIRKWLLRRRQRAHITATQASP